MGRIEERLDAIESWLAIGELRARYCHLLDDRNWDAFADLFTEDGEFDGLARVQGRAEIHRFFSTTVERLAEGFWHFCTNASIDLNGDEASGRISMQYLSVKNGTSFVSAGHYDDELVRSAGQWRFRRRRITFYYHAPLSEGFTGQPTFILPDGTPLDGLPPHRAA
ncbi:nuclear transport factor 2 family protein [Notoacmeibacter sp. MSK16QG-6]|uniref:nuclear transport factor 2 family protein n=1 Tax=Notoacmeibacter sp. MSK16QG-6 TaxID=2957982 RepID=UPI00209FD84A|nr:nuclear transport factor 2 family protein [Notoacmeibacter sp. MSK16QG-6]MCP1198357.1 nuclear transport factor 2 family protein [Notoacmeibacter sp. MSK16QG-6]